MYMCHSATAAEEGGDVCTSTVERAEGARWTTDDTGTVERQISSMGVDIKKR